MTADEEETALRAAVDGPRDTVRNATYSPAYDATHLVRPQVQRRVRVAHYEPAVRTKLSEIHPKCIRVKSVAAGGPAQE